jgi:hypothetical protein
MKIYTNCNNYLLEIFAHINSNIKEIIVATFGLLTPPTFTTTFKILEKLNREEAKVLVGLSKKGDNFSTSLYNDFSRISWRFSFTSHLKAIAISYKGSRKVCFFGGRNLGGSEWNDLSCRVEGQKAQQIYSYVKRCWQEGVLSPDIITEAITISQELDRHKELFDV